VSCACRARLEHVSQPRRCTRLVFIFRLPTNISSSTSSLTNNMISFKDTQLALIHIPLHLYANFVPPILRLLLPDEPQDHAQGNNGNGAVQPPRGWPYEHPFVNISVTPIECSVVCSRRLARKLFVPVQAALSDAERQKVSITDEDFVVMQIDGEGLDAGQRVLELTSPLALAGM
jgi:hypothetical protein